MKVVIGGGGRVGTTLATHLALEGHTVALIDHDASALARVGLGFPGSTHRGKVFDRATLESAGIASADAFCAVTSGDNSNVVAAIVARELYRVPKVIARIYDPRRAEIYRRLGVQAISSTAWSVNEIHSLLAHPRMAEETTFGDGEVRLVSIEVPPRLDGRPVDDLAVPSQVLPVALVRSGRSMIAAPGTPLASGDILSLAVLDAGMDLLERMVQP